MSAQDLVFHLGSIFEAPARRLGRGALGPEPAVPAPGVQVAPVPGVAVLVPQAFVAHWCVDVRRRRRRRRQTVGQQRQDEQQQAELPPPPGLHLVEKLHSVGIIRNLLQLEAAKLISASDDVVVVVVVVVVAVF